MNRVNPQNVLLHLNQHFGLTIEPPEASFNSIESELFDQISGMLQQTSTTELETVQTLDFDEETLIMHPDEEDEEDFGDDIHSYTLPRPSTSTSTLEAVAQGESTSSEYSPSKDAREQQAKLQFDYLAKAYNRCLRENLILLTRAP